MKRRSGRQNRLTERFLALWTVMLSPNVKQRDAFARYCHTLSAAGTLGALTLIFSEAPITYSIAWPATAMFLVAVLLFVFGALVLEEE